MDDALEVVYTLGVSSSVGVVLDQLYGYGASHVDPGEGEGEYYVVWSHIDCRRTFERGCGVSPSMLLSND
jgi:hypothetical protein